MRISVQTDNLGVLREAVESGCDEVRFGAEFCEWRVPSLEALKEAYSLSAARKKEFRYVTPRVSSKTIEVLRSHLNFLNGSGETAVVINDLGTLNMLGQYPNLRPHLGRQLVFIPSRCPWEEVEQKPDGLFAKRRVEDLSRQTSMNHLPTIEFFKEYGVREVDVDWIPTCFPYLGFMAKHGLSTYVHLHFIPVAVTRKCHTARFLGEQNPEKCSRPCNSKAFQLENGELGLELLLHGNAVFQCVIPSPDDARKLHDNKVTGIVISVSPLERVESREKIDVLIKSLPT